MMLSAWYLSIIAALAATANTQSTSTTTRGTATATASSTASATGLVVGINGITGSIITPASVPPPSGSYQSYASQLSLATILSSSLTTSGNSTVRSNATMTSSSNTLNLVGTVNPDATATNATTIRSATSSALPSNTQLCNNYAEFCNRKYSNITEVCAHNSAFDIPNNAASNQDYGIIQQLNDGIRMIQGETHVVNDTVYACHTSCDLLNAGTLESQLTLVREWVETHPYDVVTILIVNSMVVPVHNFVGPVQNSGLEQYAYIPPKIPMYRDDWPTLSSMILSGKRVVIFMDFQADETKVPYILDEFSQIWETPYSPTDDLFPCTQQRPPGISKQQAEQRMYIANHNLNVEINLVGQSLLIPNFADITEVNAANGTSSLGRMANECTAMWDTPPNFLLVDFYNEGNGSVFEVAAKMNNVTYRGNCCGKDATISLANPRTVPLTILVSVVVVIAGMLCVL